MSRVLGPFLGTDLPADWAETVDLARPWASCRLRSHWFAVAAGDPERVAAVGALDAEWAPGLAWMGPTFVREEFRGRGFQALLLAARLGLAEQLGVAEIETAVDTANTPSLRNVQNAGFRVVWHDPLHDHLVLRWARK